MADTRAAVEKALPREKLTQARAAIGEVVPEEGGEADAESRPHRPRGRRSRDPLSRRSSRCPT